jgi:mRNA interferase RelE/StbE
VADYTVELTAHARKQYKALDPAVRKRIRAALRELEDDPAPATVKSLSGHNSMLRIRVGDWRIIYRIEHQHVLVVVMDIGHRSTVYRRV